MAITDILPYVGSVLSIGVTIGGIAVAMRSGYSKSAGEIQDRVISALKEEINVLENKVHDLEKDRDRQNSILSTIRNLLKQKGWKIIIEGDFVTISDIDGRNRKGTHIQHASAIQGENDDDT